MKTLLRLVPSAAAIPSEAAVSELFREGWGKSGFPYAKSENGRPSPYGGVDWSVSHSKEFDFFAVSEASVWIDVETRKIRHADVKEALHPSLWPFCDDGGFFQAWTMAESVCKLTGEGVDAVSSVALVSTRPRVFEFGSLGFSRISDMVCGNREFVVVTGSVSESAYSVAFFKNVPGFQI